LAIEEDIELFLNRNYSFDVVVDHQSEKYAGKLQLSPQKITLTVMGEYDDEKDAPEFSSYEECIVCRGFFPTIILFENHTPGLGWRNLSRHPKHKGFFEIMFEVGYLVFSKSHFSTTHGIREISVVSETISDWIGNTDTQENIIDMYFRREDLFDDPRKRAEFVVKVENVGILGVEYQISQFYDSSSYKAGVIFPPEAFIGFPEPVKTQNVKKIYDELYSLFAYLVGGELDIEAIKVGIDTYPSTSKGFLYLPTEHIPQRSRYSIILFPLSKDIRFGDAFGPPLPLEIFQNFFQLNSSIREYWSKYLKYRRMENYDEKFLGYFRLLEKAISRESPYFCPKLLTKFLERIKPILKKHGYRGRDIAGFVGRVKSMNSSKINIQNLLEQMYDSLPKDMVRKWEIDRSGIKDVVIERNNMTHAHPSYIGEEDLYKYTFFIEILLIFALGEKIGMKADFVQNYIHRMQGYHLVSPPEEKIVMMPSTEKDRSTE